MSADQLAKHDIALVLAGNPGPFTLGGTNTWLVGRTPAWIIDPGPALPEHVDAVVAEGLARGGVAGIALTHDHADHAEAVSLLRARLGDPPVAGARGDVQLRLADGDNAGPLRALAAPGHAPDHLALICGPVAFTGDAVLGEGSVFIAPDPGALAGYLRALGRLRELGLELLCPGHGPIVVDPDAKLDEYIEHRLDRERRLVAALEGGATTQDELLDEVWSDAPAALRMAAAVTLRAHLDRLDEEGRLPESIELSAWPTPQLG